MTPEQDGTTKELGEQVGWPIDRAKTEDVIHGYARTTDLKDWQAFANLFTEHGSLVLPWEGKFAGATGRQELKRFSREGLSRFERTQHLLSNIQIAIDGDAAEATYCFQAVHVRRGDDADHWDVGGWYRAECRCTSEGWRFARVELSVSWQSGAGDD